MSDGSPPDPKKFGFHKVPEGGMRPAPTIGTVPPQLDTSKARYTIVEKVYHYLPNEGPTLPHEARYQNELTSDEQPYVRRMKVGPQWNSLDCGWIKTASVLVLDHDKGESVVTVAVLHDLHSRINANANAEDYFVPFSILSPGESMRLRPVDLSDIFLRSDSECVVIVVLLPE